MYKVTIQEDTDWLKVSTNRPELFSVRPGRIEPGGMAYLFSNHPELVGDVEIKVNFTLS